jgi:hypothetical protein
MSLAILTVVVENGEETLWQKNVKVKSGKF